MLHTVLGFNLLLSDRVDRHWRNPLFFQPRARCWCLVTWISILVECRSIKTRFYCEAWIAHSQEAAPCKEAERPCRSAFAMRYPSPSARISGSEMIEARSFVHLSTTARSWKSSDRYNNICATPSNLVHRERPVLDSVLAVRAVLPKINIPRLGQPCRGDAMLGTDWLTSVRDSNQSQ